MGPDQTDVSQRADPRERVDSVPLRSSGTYAVSYGAGHPPRPRTGAELLKKARLRVLAGADGVAHHALLARIREPVPA